jgi:hypothetical protein
VAIVGQVGGLNRGVGIVATGDGIKLLQKFSQAKGQERKVIFEFITKRFRKEAKIAAGYIIKTQLGSGAAGAQGRDSQGRFGKKVGVSPSGTPNKERKARRSGNLARSIEGRSVLFNGAPGLQVGIFRGPALKYAAIQELGTKKYNPDSPFDSIRPVRAKSLAVPVSKLVLTPAGVPRYGSPRQFPEKLVALRFKSPKNPNVIGRLVLENELRRAREQAILRAFQGRNAKGQYTKKRIPQIDWTRIKTIYLLLLKSDIKPGAFLLDGMQDYIPTLVANLADAFEEEFFSP